MVVGAALALRFAPHAIALAAVAGGALYVMQLRSANATQELAITRLGERAAELHTAWESERESRERADASNARLAATLMAQRERSRKRDARLAALSVSSPQVRQWRAGRLDAGHDARLREAYAAATRAQRARAATRAPDPPVPDSAGQGR